MSWRSMLQSQDEALVLPWIGGRKLCRGTRCWELEGPLPVEYGWYEFRSSSSRKARLSGPAEPATDILKDQVRGYLVGDRLVADRIRIGAVQALAEAAEPVSLIEAGLDRFVRIAAARWFLGGPLVFQGQEFPLGPEDAVLSAYLEGKSSVDDVPGVPPALDSAFRIECWWRDRVAARRRAEQERKRQDSEWQRQALEQKEIEDRLLVVQAQLGTGAGRRAVAQLDFAEAARAALALGGAALLDHRAGVTRNEMVVRFSVENRRFECVCDRQSLRIIDAGICLTDSETGERGDSYFTLESLPGVIMEAARSNQLVVFRHA